jgi:hypothetical protein
MRRTAMYLTLVVALFITQILYLVKSRQLHTTLDLAHQWEKTAHMWEDIATNCPGTTFVTGPPTNQIRFRQIWFRITTNNEIKYDK